MALTKCAECGREVSTKAATCPGCGAPIAETPPAGPAALSNRPATVQKASGNARIAKAAAVIVVGTFLVVYAQIKMQPGDAPEPANAPATAAVVQSATAATAPAGAPLQVDALKLATDYHQNEVAADAKYKGRRIAISGTVKSIAKDLTDDPYVTLATDNEFMSVQANFKKGSADEADLAKLHPGDTVTVTCIGTGMVMGSPMLKCS